MHLFLFAAVPDPGDGLHLHRPLYLQLCPLRQGGNILILSLQLALPLLARPRRHRPRRLQAFFQLHQHPVTGEVFNHVLIGPAKANGARIEQRGQGTVGAKRDKPRQVAMDPLKPRGGRQAGIDGNNLLKGCFEGVDMGDFACQLSLLVGVSLQANRAGQAHGGLTAAGFRLLLDKQMAVVPERHLQRGFAGMLNHIDAVERLVFRILAYRRQLKDAGGQQAALAQGLFQLLQFALELAKGAVQTFNEVIAGHIFHLSYNMLDVFLTIADLSICAKAHQAEVKLGN